MKVLFVTYHYLHGHGGGIFATLAYVNALAELSDETVFMFPSMDGLPDSRIHPSVRQIPVFDTLSLAGKMSRAVFQGVIHRFGTAFRELLAQERFDMVTFHNSKASRKLIDFAHAHGAKVITIHNNYERDFTRDNEPWYRLPFVLPAALKSERESVRKSDLNLVLCGTDRELLHLHYDPRHRTRIGILGVFEYARREFAVREQVDAPVFVMTGNLSTRQAEESLIPWFKKELPILRETVPDDYDRLIQLCDAISGAEGVMDIVDRMSDVKRRYGSYDPDKWDANLALKAYFEDRMGKDLYEAVEKDRFSPSPAGQPSC